MGGSVLHCKDCDYSAPMLGNLRIHVFRIHMNSMYSCPDCDKSFKDRSEAFTHLIKSHDSSDEALIACHCTVCSFSTDDYNTFVEHCESVHLLPGSRKRKKTTSKDNNLETSAKLKDGIPNRERGCEGPTNIRCNICSSDARDGRDLLVHKLTAHGLCKYTCSKCDFKTRMSTTLSIHGQRAHQETIKLKFACGFCSVSNKMDTMQAHLMIAHPDEYKKRMAAKLYYCNNCDFQHISERKLMKHTHIAHPGDGVISIPEDNDDLTVIEVKKKKIENLSNTSMQES